ncbi:MAG: NTP transferase domain-containing protein, partial [Candidatus Heimdallarchaeota archaeon]|nr:NTP transferase domain-containing protein [Candidatus Heimdallarchaeota archaeon]
MKFDAIILAGHSEKDSELLIQEKVTRKAFLKLDDKMFIEHQITAIKEIKGIRDIYISGMSADQWKTDHTVIFDDYEGDIIDKLRYFRNTIFSDKEEPDYVLIISGDTPLITTENLERFIEKCKTTSDGELTALYYMCLIDEKDMVSKFPDSERTYVHLKDVSWCSGDTILAKPSIIDSHGEILEQVVRSRKAVFKALLIFSPITVIKLFFRRITMQGFNDVV